MAGSAPLIMKTAGLSRSCLNPTHACKQTSPAAFAPAGLRPVGDLAERPCLVLAHIHKSLTATTRDTVLQSAPQKPGRKVSGALIKIALPYSHKSLYALFPSCESKEH